MNYTYSLSTAITSVDTLNVQAVQTRNLPQNHKFLSGIMYSTSVKQTFSLWYQIKCCSLCAPPQIFASVQHFLPYMCNAWGLKPVTHYRFDTDETWQPLLTHSWAGVGCSGPAGRSWILVGWRCRSLSFGTEASGPEEKTAARMLFRIRLYNLQHNFKLLLKYFMSCMGVASQAETLNSCLGGSFSGDKLFKSFWIQIMRAVKSPLLQSKNKMQNLAYSCCKASIVG